MAAQGVFGRVFRAFCDGLAKLVPGLLKPAQLHQACDREGPAFQPIRLQARDGTGLLQRLAAFRAYEDPLRKKSHLLVKILMRRGLFLPTDADCQEVPVDPVLVHMALRAGLVTVTDEELVERCAPGAIETGRLTAHGRTMEQVREALVPLHPIGRLGQPEEIGDAALFLASDESRFVTGHDLIVDGGYTAI